MGKATLRNAFTSGSMDDNPFFNPFDLAFKNVANTCVLSWAGKVYALWEVGVWKCGRWDVLTQVRYIFTCPSIRP